MFARRKPRPQDEEPIVPHGLIWQATEEPMPPSKASQPESASAPVRPLEMPKFWRKPPEPDPSVRRAPAPVPAENVRPPHARSRGGLVEMASPLAPVQELTKRRMLIEEERSQRSPSAARSSPELPEAPLSWGETQDASKLTSSDARAATKTGPALASSTPQASSLPAVTTAVVMTDKVATLGATENSSSQAPTRSSASPAQALRKTWGRVGELGRVAVNLLKSSQQKALALARDTTKLRDRVRAAYERQSLAQRIHLVRRPVDVSTPAKKEDGAFEVSGPENSSRLKIKYELAATVVGSHIRSWSNWTQRLGNRRVKVRILAVSPLVRFISAARQVDVAVVNALRKNARLAASMSMAALSTFLALGMILVVRNYEPARASSPHAEKTVAAKTTQHAVVANTSSSVSTSEVHAKSMSANVSPKVIGKPTPVVRNAADRKPIRRPVHHGRDDDYVARDTYVYYGNR